MRKINILKELDWLSIGLYLLLILSGSICLYATIYEPEVSVWNLSSEFGKQLLWAGVSIPLIFLVLLTNGEVYKSYSWLFFTGAIGLLVAVLIIGKEVGGAKSWLAIGGFSIQPTEFAKFATLLFLASIIDIPQFFLREWKSIAVVGAVVSIVLLLIMLQPDAGSALVYVSLIFALYREGLPSVLFYSFLAAIAIVIVTLLQGVLVLAVVVVLLLAIALWWKRQSRRRKKVWKAPVTYAVLAIVFSQVVQFGYQEILKPHQRNRIDVILGKVEDPHGLGYNLEQSKIAIGSGGWTGKGILQGTQTNFNFVPKQSTDFIFCTVGEEWGFLGCLFVLACFLALILRVVWLSEKQKSKFTRFYGYGVAGIFFIHVFINISMTVGIMPVIGIPLPFFSYGGSSFLGFTLLLFIFIKLASERKTVLGV